MEASSTGHASAPLADVHYTAALEIVERSLTEVLLPRRGHAQQQSLMPEAG